MTRKGGGGAAEENGALSLLSSTLSGSGGGGGGGQSNGGKAPLTWSHKRSLKAVAISPFYARASAKFCVAQASQLDALVVHENGWLGAKETLVSISQTTTTIWTMAWHASSLAYCDEEGTKILDWPSKRIVWSTPRDAAALDIRVELCRPILHWHPASSDFQPFRLFLAWANQLDIYHVLVSHSKKK